ncbi:unnamed protein product, partial [Meganyctiphanes norvegica]
MAEIKGTSYQALPLDDSSTEKSVKNDVLNNVKPLFTKNNEHYDGLDPISLTSSDAYYVVLSYTGNYGRWQWQMFLITSFCGLFTALHNLSAAFMAATPEHWCSIPALENANITLDTRNISIPWIEKDGEWQYSSCEYYVRDYSALVAEGIFDGHKLPDLPTNVSTATCQQWHYDDSIYKTTVVGDWNLVCNQKFLMSVVQSTYMSGVLIGAVILSELSDKFGRRTIALLSAVGFLITSVATAFSNHYITFIVLRFFVAFFGSGLFLPCFVLLMEVVGPEARTFMGMNYQSFFSVGFMLLPLIAYYVREWRNLQLAISIPSVSMLAYYWLLPESPRWLLSHGRQNEALKVLSQIAKVNGKELPKEEELNFLLNKIDESSDEQISLKQKCLKLGSSLVTLVRTPNMRRRCCVMFFAWFVVSMIYYGLTFSGGNIAASVYLMVFLSGVVEIPSYMLVSWTLNLWGRRINLTGLFLICGAACLAIIAVPKEMVWVNMTLASFGKFFNSSAFAVAYIYSAELVPTSVRNICVGTSSMWARLGSTLAPFVVDLLVHYTIPSTVFVGV